MQEAVVSDSVLTRKAIYVQLAVSMCYVNTHNKFSGLLLPFKKTDDEKNTQI